MHKFKATLFDKYFVMFPRVIKENTATNHNTESVHNIPIRSRRPAIDRIFFKIQATFPVIQTRTCMGVSYIFLETKQVRNHITQIIAYQTYIYIS